MKCFVKDCKRQEAAGCRGLCMMCYSKAKKTVEAGKTSWDELINLGLVREEEDIFSKDLARRKEGK